MWRLLSHQEGLREAQRRTKNSISDPDPTTAAPPAVWPAVEPLWVPNHREPSLSPCFSPDMSPGSRCPPPLLLEPREIDAHCISSLFFFNATRSKHACNLHVPPNPAYLTVSRLPSTEVASVCTGGGCSPLAPSDAIIRPVAVCWSAGASGTR